MKKIVAFIFCLGLFAQCETHEIARVAVTGVCIVGDGKDLIVGQSYQVRAEVLPDNATNKMVSWMSESPDILSVDSNGMLTANGAGKARIRVTTDDGGFEDTIFVVVHPLKVAVSGVKIDFDNISLTVGQTYQARAIVFPKNATNKKISWTIDHPDVATVDSNGMLTANGAGEAKIRVKTDDGGFVDASYVTVRSPGIGVEGVSLNYKYHDLTMGDSLQLVATVYPKGASDKRVEWSSSNTAIADVDKDGMVRPVATGTAIIYVVTMDGKKSASCYLTVKNEHPVTGVFLNCHQCDVYEGDCCQLSATVLPENATEKAMVWGSDNSGIVSITQEGVVFGKSVGKTYIWVSAVDGGFSDMCYVNVIKQPIRVSGVSISPEYVQLQYGEAISIVESIAPSDADNQGVSWTSSDGLRVRQIETHVWKAFGASSGHITVTTMDGGYTASCFVEIFPLLLEVKLDISSAELIVGEKLRLAATLVPEEVKYPELQWSSSNPEVAKVDATGVVTAVGCGSSEIIVWNKKEPEIRDFCIIEVSSREKGDIDPIDFTDWD